MPTLIGIVIPFEALRRFQRRNEGSNVDEIIDLSVVDIVRDRRRGVPRFNDFRAALHKPPIRDWNELSADPETVRRMRAQLAAAAVDSLILLPCHAHHPPRLAA